MVVEEPADLVDATVRLLTGTRKAMAEIAEAPAPIDPVDDSTRRLLGMS